MISNFQTFFSSENAPVVAEQVCVGSVVMVQPAEAAASLCSF